MTKSQIDFLESKVVEDFLESAKGSETLAVRQKARLLQVSLSIKSLMTKKKQIDAEIARQKASLECKRRSFVTSRRSTLTTMKISESKNVLEEFGSQSPYQDEEYLFESRLLTATADILDS